MFLFQVKNSFLTPQIIDLDPDVQKSVFKTLSLDYRHLSEFPLPSS